MIHARLVLDSKGSLRVFDAEGHAEKGARGQDIVCAAFSVLARTAYRALEATPGIELRGWATEPGLMCFEVFHSSRREERAVGIADFLVMGLGDLARDYPEAVVLTIERDWEE